MGVQFRLLGGVEAIHDGRPVTLGRRRERCLLGVLLLDLDRPVPVQRLVDLLWDGDPPATALRQLRVHVSRLRATLHGASEDARILTRGETYLITIDPQRVDVHRFRDGVHAARRITDAASRAEALARTLALWRGPVLGDAATDRLRDRLASELEELYLLAVEEQIDAELAIGQHREILGRLGDTVARHPMRQRLVGLYMIALYRAGHQPEALNAYRRLRAHLADELGLDPDHRIQQLHQGILRADPDLELPSHAVVPRPAQLPLEVTGFAGRRHQLDQLEQLLSGGHESSSAMPIAAISGTAGVGKTALAVHWAHRVAHRFPDGQLYADLRGFDPTGRVTEPGDVIREFLDALGVAASRLPPTPDAQVTRYRSLIAGRRLLVLLDNARDADQVRALLPGTTTVLTIVTSRNPLTSLVAIEGAVPLTLDPMPAAEAGDLLAGRLGAARTAAEPEAVDAIVTACARLPLALAVTAARAQHTGFPLAVIAAELADAGQPLEVLDAGDPAGQVRAVFSWSYTALTPPAARFFRLLSLHPGPDITVAAAASLAGVSAMAARRQLAALTRGGLLSEPSPGRFGCHDLLRAYAAELADREDPEPDRRAAFIRLLDHYLHTTHAAELLLDPHRNPITIPLRPPAPDAIVEVPCERAAANSWLFAETRVVLAVLQQAAGAGLDTHTWQLTWSLTNHLHRIGSWWDLAKAWKIALHASSQLGFPAARADAHRYLAHTELRLGRPDAGIEEHLRQALSLYGEAGDPVNQAHIYRSLAMLCERQGSPALGLEHSQRALLLYEGADDVRGQARALNAVGWYHILLGDHAEALRQCERSLEILRRLGDRHGSACTWDSLGYAHHQAGSLVRAAECYEQALAAYREVGDRYGEADTLEHLGDTRRDEGNPAAARATWQLALDIMTELDQPTASTVTAKLRTLRDG